jgi:hypothetical protein
MMLSLWYLLTAAAQAPLLEVELRWVAQSVLLDQTALSTAGQAGALSTRSAPSSVQALGPAVRVQSGGTAQWSLELTQAPLRLQTQMPQGAGRAQFNAGAEPQRWLLEATPQWRSDKQALQLQIQWQQPVPEGGQQRWQSVLPVVQGRWTTVARDATPASASARGVLSTRSTGQVRELQVRVNLVLE